MDILQFIKEAWDEFICAIPAAIIIYAILQAIKYSLFPFIIIITIIVIIILLVVIAIN